MEVAGPGTDVCRGPQGSQLVLGFEPPIPIGNRTTDRIGLIFLDVVKTVTDIDGLDILGPGGPIVSRHFGRGRARRGTEEQPWDVGLFQELVAVGDDLCCPGASGRSRLIRAPRV